MRKRFFGLIGLMVAITLWIGFNGYCGVENTTAQAEGIEAVTSETETKWESKVIEEKEGQFVIKDLYIQNPEMGNRNIYALEITPANMETGSKIPILICVHGGEGNAYSMSPYAKRMAEAGIAALSIECCGGIRNPKSDGKELFSSHYSSRISDLNAAIDYAKTLDYVDPEQIYLVGESYGGAVIMLAAAYRTTPEGACDIAGLILESTGFGPNSLFEPAEDDPSVIWEYVPEDPFTKLQEYTGRVVCFCGTEDAVGAYDNGKYTIDRYNESERAEPAVFYSLEGSGHGYVLFTDEAREEMINVSIEMINGE